MAVEAVRVNEITQVVFIVREKKSGNVNHGESVYKTSTQAVM